MKIPKSRYHIIFMLSIFLASSIHGENFHNIHNFHGVRAGGMGGAVTAIIAEPAGQYYNPAGLALIKDDAVVSGDVSGFSRHKKTYFDAMGPNEHFTENSRESVTNFLGLAFGNENFTWGLAYLARQSERYRINENYLFTMYDAGNFQYNPATGEVAYASQGNNYTGTLLGARDNDLYGGGLGKSLNSMLSVGMSLFYEVDFINTSMEASRFKTPENEPPRLETFSMSYERVTKSLLPVIGVMFSPEKNLKLGFSLNKRVVMSNDLKYKLHGNEANKMSIYEFSHRGGGLVYRDDVANLNRTAIQEPFKGTIPETYEARGGIAYEWTQHLLSFDVIYTSQNRANNYVKTWSPPSNPAEQHMLLLTDNSVLTNFNRDDTTNYALGYENSIFCGLILRFGLYSNFSNNKTRESRIESLIHRAAFSNPYAISLHLKTDVPGFGQVYYMPPARRAEQVDNVGVTFGVQKELTWLKGFQLRTILLNVALRYERGVGHGYVFSGLNRQKLLQERKSLYISIDTCFDGI